VVAVENPRRYRSDLRVEQAASTRERIVDAAISSFAELGYAKTTMAQIARRAGVSVETVHKNGPKAALLDAAVLVASVGLETHDDILQSAYAEQLVSPTDPRESLRNSVRLVLDFNAGSVGVWRAYSAAADTDPAINARWRILNLSIRDNLARVLDHWAARGWLRSDSSRDDLLATLWTITSVEGYDRLTAQLGWSDDHYLEWLETTGERLLFAPIDANG